MSEFKDDEPEICFSIPIVDDDTVEESEIFNVRLTTSDDTVTILSANASVTIIDDDQGDGGGSSDRGEIYVYGQKMSNGLSCSSYKWHNITILLSL